MTLTCHNFKKPGHKMKDCKQLTKNSDKSSNVENDKSKWCSYHHNDGYSIKDCYQQQPESANLDDKKRWCNYHKSESHSDDDCYQQRNGKHNSTADSDSKKYETFITGSTVNDCDKNTL